MYDKKIALAIKFKRRAKGTQLQDEAGRDVKDVFGNPIKCQGGWNDPVIPKQLCSAISAICRAKGVSSTESYCEECDECLDLDQQQLYHGCDLHRGRPQIRRTGNPCNSQIVKNELRRSLQDGQGKRI